ncbi:MULTISPECIES: universal stress protein [unclassified Chryseobacterium]|uniref:universal stress protein n=1 Tax=unclassified Chryseobacterium TaxID=2593645 RepID=UPI000F44F8B9|nr:universal stress protein [Chryseobacterium sp. G0240]ROI05066.1 universal stress protein [Chryseobacterium sp. G0240]
MKFEKILIAVDDSAFGMKAARVGFELAHQLSASIAIVYVIDTVKEMANPDLGVNEKQQHAILLGEAEQTIRQYIELYDGVDKVFRFTPEGEPHKEIINVAAQWQADLIVMGTHGRTGITRLLMGSVADYILKHAKVPVLITPPEMTS